MANLRHSADEPLLPNLADAEKVKPPHSTFATFFRWALGIAMWLVFGFWVVVMLVSPLDSAGNMYLENWTKVASGSIYGITGSIFLVFSGPILVIAFLAIVSLNIAGEKELQWSKSSKRPRFRLRTFPVLVSGPFGVVSAAEFIGICLFVLFALWVVCAYATDILDHLWEGLQAPSNGKWLEILERSGFHLGSIVMYCLAFLFLPITRGSVLLRIIDVPFEQATRYHISLGHLAMCFITLHGLCYITIWVMQGVLLDKVCPQHSCSCLVRACLIFIFVLENNIYSEIVLILLCFLDEFLSIWSCLIIAQFILSE
ncbi:hypothetical protein BT93_I1544 [Corymbia citriodora subsp. variegata]|nr:hypothetical protein BT93_I1544 [Corymbia citriodora subsp. variegata]